MDKAQDEATTDKQGEEDTDAVEPRRALGDHGLGGPELALAQVVRVALGNKALKTCIDESCMVGTPSDRKNQSAPNGHGY